MFERHPDNPEPYRVLLRRLGAEMLVQRGWVGSDYGPWELMGIVNGYFQGLPFVLQMLAGDFAYLLPTDALAGINLPEAGDCYFDEMATFVLARLGDPSGQFRVEGVDYVAVDAFGHTLVGADYIWMRNELFNLTLVWEGYATVDPNYDNLVYQPQFLIAERQAREQSIGLWGACDDDTQMMKHPPGFD